MLFQGTPAVQTGTSVSIIERNYGSPTANIVERLDQVAII
jgi:hypothetical protein